jgi:hypothetical protein
MKTFANEIIHFYRNLNPPAKLPGGIDWLFPQKDKIVFNAIESFYNKYYYDNNQRSLIFGINPGRFGAGTTGINFTAPKQLKQHCEIAHSFKNQTELSAEFIYEMIIAYGGCNKFYGDFIISAVSPLGFIKNGRNLNYYDDKELLYAVTPFIIDCINKQTKWKVNREKSFCIGGEKNFKFLYALNEKHKWFIQIIPLPHPRFIMQYQRKQKQKFIGDYLQALVNT